MPPTMLAVQAVTFRPMAKPSTFADRLAEALKASGKSRAELAKRLYSDAKQTVGVSAQAIGQALDGTTKSLSANNTARAARFLGVDFYWLATGEGVAAPAELAEAPVDQVVYRLGVLLGGMDELARTTAASLLSQLAMRPDEAHRIADLMKSVAGRPEPAPGAGPQTSVSARGDRFRDFPPAPAPAPTGPKTSSTGTPNKKSHAQP